jgi:hypothetical protein
MLASLEHAINRYYTEVLKDYNPESSDQKLDLFHDLIGIYQEIQILHEGKITPPTNVYDNN